MTAPAGAAARASSMVAKAASGVSPSPPGAPSFTYRRVAPAGRLSAKSPAGQGGPAGWQAVLPRKGNSPSAQVAKASQGGADAGGRAALGQGRELLGRPARRAGPRAQPGQVRQRRRRGGGPVTLPGIGRVDPAAVQTRRRDRGEAPPIPPGQRRYPCPAHCRPRPAIPPPAPPAAAAPTASSALACPSPRGAPMRCRIVRSCARRGNRFAWGGNLARAAAAGTASGGLRPRAESSRRRLRSGSALRARSPAAAPSTASATGLVDAETQIDAPVASTIVRPRDFPVRPPGDVAPLHRRGAARALARRRAGRLRGDGGARAPCRPAPPPRSRQARRRTLDPARILEIEERTRHDVIAFLTHVEELRRRAGALAAPRHDLVGRARHGAGASSCAQRARPDRRRRRAAARRAGARAPEHARTPMIGRSHGIHAEPITAGAGVRPLVRRARPRRRAPRQRARSGDRGRQDRRRGRHATPTSSPAIEARGAGAARPPAGDRRHADRRAATATPRCSCALALLGTAVEQIALGVRHWQRTEVGEAEEALRAGPEGLERDAAQEEPDPRRRTCAGSRALLRAYAGAGARGRRAVARARHLALVGRARRPRPTRPILADFMVDRAAGLVERPGRPPRAHARRT